MAPLFPNLTSSIPFSLGYILNGATLHPSVTFLDGAIRNLWFRYYQEYDGAQIASLIFRIAREAGHY
jgi:hypothetical protein